ncbi:TrmB family transcriptional regulator [Methanobacterium alcaliphilum]|uniref:TrmB family transcriptional regulator n=1 Tax=Methanobacterium alcaliphilum TaxID=392018 RepID=UPI003CCBE2DE|nr:TrmB family transcriptional regulator [Methanobacterium alcaliphilum]
MPLNKKTWNSLKIMGLTDYEATTYLTLTSMISGTATEISNDSKVPRSRIYDILKEMAKKGFVEIERGRPLKYVVVPPAEIFQKHRQSLMEDLEEAELELTADYESQISKVPAPIWLIHGPEKIIKKEMEIISRAKESINIRAGFMFEGEAEHLKSKINKANRRGVKTKIMAAPFAIIGDKKIHLSKELAGINAEIRIYQIPFVKMIVRDGMEMMLIFSKFSGKEKKAVSQSAIGVWNQYPEIARNYANVFENMWEGDMPKRG